MEVHKTSAIIIAIRVQKKTPFTKNLKATGIQEYWNDIKGSKKMDKDCSGWTSSWSGDGCTGNKEEFNERKAFPTSVECLFGCLIVCMYQYSQCRLKEVSKCYLNQVLGKTWFDNFINADWLNSFQHQKIYSGIVTFEGNKGNESLLIRDVCRKKVIDNNPFTYIWNESFWSVMNAPMYCRYEPVFEKNIH